MMQIKPGPDSLLLPPILDINAILNSAAERLRRAGIETPALDARLLLQHVLGIDHAVIITNGERPLTPQERARYEQTIARRLARVPVHRIIGQREFWGLDLEISVDVLEPRADTERLVEIVLQWIWTHGLQNDQLRLADIGTGSGAIVLALLSELNYATAVATDNSPAALAMAKTNACNHALDQRLNLIKGNYLEPLSGRFDVIVSNPPYIATSHIERLEPEVGRCDPFIALDGGADGLAAYRVLLAGTAAFLEPDGRAFFEIGYDQAAKTTAIAHQTGWRQVQIARDHGGNDRVLAVSS